MDYKIIWDDEAITELAQVVGYISKHNPTAAEKTGKIILQKVEMLSSFPRIGKLFSLLQGDEVREIPVPPYRIIYHVKEIERVVRILKVFHGARQEPEIK
ncbi:MAG TPA: type II toxin-antitoxin system RelE/ParE family toxin [Pseudomonadales bacterium]|nr:type II toxin-antitoxin system RelE/ParE family toxin [Pseudomonadales bacterium]